MKLEVAAKVTRHGGFTLDVNLAVDADALGLVGPSGSGKSTLLNAIAGIDPGAQVRVDGGDWSRLAVERRAVGYVTQDALLFPHLSVRRNLLFSPRATSLGDVPDALAITHLLARMPRNLSGGERRRVALGRAVLSQPRLLLLDEPFAGLDELRRREAMALLDHVRRAYKLPMILVSHIAEEVIGLTEHTVRLEAGRVVAAGPSHTVLRASETAIDNFFEGSVTAPGRVRVGPREQPVELHAELPADATGHVRLACYAHDILLATAPPTGISARNVIPVRVRTVTPLGDAAAIVLVEPPALRITVTRDALQTLAIAPGARLFAVIKATSIAYLGSA